MARTLERFSIARAADGYLLTIEDDSGETIELNASFDQIDLITEELENALDADEELELGDDENEDQPPHDE